MSGYNMPDDLSQAAFDRAQDQYDDDTIRCDCGHWDSEAHAEMVHGRLLCLRCADPLPMDTEGAIDRLRETLMRTRPDVRQCPECSEPIIDGDPKGHKEGCSR